MLTMLLAEQSLEAAFAEELDNIALGAVIILIVAIICSTSMIKNIAIERARQATKRELAAYIAEGSIKPLEAIEILNAGRDLDTREVIAKSAADGWISADKADTLLKALENRRAAEPKSV